MTPAIERIRAKVTRAKQHIEDFQLALRDFAATDPYGIAMKEDLDARKRVYYVTKLSPVPLNLEAIVADALSNLREALDHIAYQIELGACGSPPQHRVYFPIAQSAAQYPALRDRYIECAGQDAIDAIDATEPYKGGKGHALWQLNELKKPDKHHLLIATRSNSVVDFGEAVAEMMRESWPPGAPVEKLLEMAPPLIFRETPVADITLSGSGDAVPRFEIPADMAAIATAIHTGGGNFAVISIAEDGSNNDLLVNTIGAYSGTVLFDESDQHSVAFEVTAGGSWSIVIKPLTAAFAWDGVAALSGPGDDVARVEPPISGLATAQVSHSGEGNFAIIAYGSSGQDLLVNEIGNYSGEVLIGGGTFFLEITADGPWSVTPS